MPNRSALVPNTYRKPDFIPDGFIDVLGALTIAVEPFDDEWTEDEVRQRRDEAAHKIKQICFAGDVPTEIITASGVRHPIRQHKWGGADANRIFDQGTTTVSDGVMYFESTIKGHVLFPEAELRRALGAGEPVAEEPRATPDVLTREAGRRRQRDGAKGSRSLCGGTVVRFTRFWMSSGECRFYISN